MIYLTGAVRGLVPEGYRITALAKRISPGVLGLSVSKEGLSAMSAHGPAKKAEPANPEEAAYIRGLSAFGEVVKPPPCYSAALETGIGVVALDMDDGHYTAAYCKYVTTLDMMRQSGGRKLILRHRFSAKTPEDFVVEWDRLVNRPRGYRTLERAREAWLARGAARLAKDHGKALVVVEHERLAGVAKNLEKSGAAFEIVR
jgi:hypothetical protein